MVTRAIGDRESMDFEVGFFGQYILIGFFQMLFILLLVVVNNPPMLIVLLVLAIFAVYQFVTHIKVNTEFRKMVNIKKAPVFSAITEAFNGSSSI